MTLPTALIENSVAIAYVNNDSVLVVFHVVGEGYKLQFQKVKGRGVVYAREEIRTLQEVMVRVSQLKNWHKIKTSWKSIKRFNVSTMKFERKDR